MRGMVVALAMRLKSSIDFFYDIHFLEMLEIMGEVVRLGKKK